MFEQNQNYGTPMMNAGAYQYGGMPNQMVKFNNPLTAEQIKRLQQKDTQFSLCLTEEEQLRGVCNHRNAEGTGDTLVYDPLTGEARCTICGYKFRPIESDVSLDVISEDVSRVVDALQTIKLMYIDLPANAAMEYFQIIPLLEKIPQLFKFAAENMTKHECYNWQYNNRNMGAVSMLNNLANMFGGMNSMSYQQPMNPGMGAPMMNAPAGFPNAAYNQQQNPFGYNGASMYTPGTTGFAYTPNQQPAQVAPTVAPATTAPAAADATVSQAVTI